MIFQKDKTVKKNNICELSRLVALSVSVLALSLVNACSDPQGTTPDETQCEGEGCGSTDAGPTITDVEISAGMTQATVTWTTSEPTTSVVEYGETASYEFGAVVDESWAVDHEITLEDLTADTQYMLRLSATNFDGQTGISEGHAFATLAQPDREPAFTSDDFSASNLDTNLWTWADPVGGSRFALTGTGTADAVLEIHVPAGAPHDLWTSNSAVRVMQPTLDIDFGLEVKFLSEPNQELQIQGIIVEEDNDSWLRFDFHFLGGALKIFASSTLNGSPSALGNTEIAAGAPLFMRVERTGDAWTQSYSRDGESWNDVASFTQPLTVAAVGVFAGSAGASGDSNANTVLVDYIFDTTEPVADEDGSTAADEAEPYVHALRYAMSTRTLHVEVATDELAELVLEYGLTESYELGEVATTEPGYTHSLSVDDLDGSSTHHFRLVAEDADGNVTETADTPVDWTISGMPVIDIWYGDSQSFGALGEPQRWINILGSVFTRSAGVTLTYTLNGGAVQYLSLGADNARLEETGDFNVELGFTDATAGTNELVLVATDAAGIVSTRTVTFDYTDGNVWPQTYEIDWSTVTDIQDVAQVVDGLWEWDDEGVRPTILGYDRLIAIGDITWQDYEVTVPITVYQLLESNENLVGIGLRWPGHTELGDTQPRRAYFPAGAFIWNRWAGRDNERFQLIGNNEANGEDMSGNLQLNTTYILKARVETQENDLPLYSVKMWEQGTDEPEGWDLTMEEGIEDPVSGCLLLVVHKTDAVFGDLTITPID